MVIRTARARARKQPAEVRREEILDAAVRVFARSPYRAASTAEIAREAGIAEPTIYRHFETKRDLYLAALERGGVSIEASVREIADASLPALEALMLFGRRYVEGMSAHPEYLQLRQRALAEAEDDEVRAGLRESFRRIAVDLASIIRRGQDEGILDAGIDPMGAAWLYIGYGLTYDLMRMVEMNDQDAHDCKHGAGEVFLRGILAVRA